MVARAIICNINPIKHHARRTHSSFAWTVVFITCMLFAFSILADNAEGEFQAREWGSNPYQK